MLESGMKSFFNENRPKFGGPKHYRARDTMMKDPYYKITSTATNKRDSKDSFFEQVIKKTNCAPNQYYKTNNIYDWSNNFKNRGKIMKNDKITFTSEVIKESKRNPVPAPNAYPHKEYIGKDTGVKSTKGS